MTSADEQFRHGLKEVEPGVRLHYVETGDGASTLVLLHGFPETWWQYRYVMPMFAEAGFRVIAVDYRGAGNSSKPQTGYDKLTMARDIQHLLVDKLEIRTPIYLVGHDLGMKVAFAYAMLFPEAVEKLILVDAIIPGTKHFKQLLSSGRLGTNDLAHFFFHNARNNVAETLTAGRERVYIQDFFDRYAFNIGAFPSEVIDVYGKAYAAPGGMRSAFEVYRAFDRDGQDNIEMIAKMGKPRMPMLFVVGQQSAFTHIADDVVAEISETGSSVSIPNSGHYPAEENPKAFAKAVIDFCKQ